METDNIKTGGCPGSSPGSVGQSPVGSDPYLDGQRNRQLYGGAHFLADARCDGIQFLLGNLKDQFIVDLKDESGCTAMVTEPTFGTDHGDLDDIGCGTLHGGIDGGSLGGLPQSRSTAFKVGQVETPAQQGFDETLLVSLSPGSLEKITDS